MLAVVFLAASSASARAADVSASCPTLHVPRPVVGSSADGATAAYSALTTTGGGNAVPQFLLTALQSELELGGEIGRQLGEYDPRAISELKVIGHASYYYIPGARGRFWSRSCLRTLSTAQRSIAEAFERHYPPGPGYCLVEAVEGEAGPLLCSTLEQSLAGYAFGLSRSSGQGDLLMGLVPDGVATVRLVYPGGAATSGAVSANLFVASAPAQATRELACEREAIRGPVGRCTHHEYVARIRAATPISVSWLGAAGAPVRQFVLTPAYLHDAERTDGLTAPFVSAE